MVNKWTGEAVERWELAFPLLVCLTAFLLRYHFLTTYNYPLMIHEQDAVGYMDVARQILHLHYVSIATPPGYPALTALFGLFTANLEFAARLASITMDALVVMPLYYIARISLSRLAAVAVCVLWAFCSFSLFFSRSPLTQSTYLFFLLAGIWFLHAGLTTERGKLWLFFAGVAIAWSFLTRPEGLIAFGCALLLTMLPLSPRHKEKRTRLLGCIALGIGFLIIAGPFLIALHNELGYWAISTKTAAALKTQDGVLQLDSAGNLQASKGGIAALIGHYGSITGFLHAAYDSLRQYADVFITAFPRWMHVLFLAGFVLLFFTTNGLYVATLFVLLLVTIPNFVFNISKTLSYVYTWFPFYFLCFILAIDRGGAFVKMLLERSIPFPAVASKCILFLILSVPVTYSAFAFYEKADLALQNPALLKQAEMAEKVFKVSGEMIRSISAPSDPIMTRWGIMAHFSQRHVILLPNGGVKEVVEYGRKKGARYLLIDTMSVKSRRQDLLELLNPLMGRPIDASYGLKPVDMRSYLGLGGYVLYRYQQ